MPRSIFYMWCILVACSSHTHIGYSYGVPMDPQRMTNPQEDLDPAKVVQEKCEEYSSRSQPMENQQPTPTDGSMDWSDICGDILISGPSDPANISEFPHMALIGEEYDKETKVEWICGGSLISPEYVLTAAHCFDQNNPGIDPTYWVVLGKTIKPPCDVRKHFNDGNNNVYRVVARIKHLEYNPGKCDNDIALLKLDRPAVFSEAIRPLCLALPPNLEYINDSQAIVTGWGQTKPSEQLSDNLRRSSLSLFSDCDEDFKNDTMLSKGFDAKNMICAGPEGKLEGDTCEGDSGGPLQFRIVSHDCDKCYKVIFYQVGITSYGAWFCNGDPRKGIYTRVSNFLPWIQSIVWPAEDPIVELVPVNSIK